MTNTDHSPVALPGAEGPPVIPWPAVVTALLGMFMAVMDGFIVIVAGPAIQADLGATSGQLQWVLAAYQLTFAVFLITAGRLADMFGLRRIFVFGTVLFTVASIACALVQIPQALILSRLVQGLGAAMIVPQVFALIALLVPEESKPRVFGWVGVAIGFATVGGQLFGGVLIGIDVFDSTWRSVFWINVPIGLVIVSLAARFLPQSRGPVGRRLDASGVVLLSAALFLLAFPLIQGREVGWAWWTWISFGCSAAAFAVFVVIERRVEQSGGEPLLRLSLFSQRSFSLGLVLIIGVYALLTSYYLALSVSLQDGLGLSAIQSGLVYAPIALTFSVFGFIAGKLIPRYGRRVLEVGSIIVASGYLSTAVILFGTDEMLLGLIIPTLMIQSVGGGLLISPSLGVVLTGVTSEAVGMASGALSTAQQIGAALGVALVGAVFFSAFRPDVEVPERAASHGFAMASLAVFIIAVLVSVVVFLLPKERPAA